MRFRWPGARIAVPVIVSTGTLIPWRKKPADQCPDGPRYKSLGNSMAVPVMSWLGQRIAAVEAIIKQEQEV